MWREGGPEGIRAISVEFPLTLCSESKITFKKVLGRC